MWWPLHILLSSFQKEQVGCALGDHWYSLESRHISYIYTHTHYKHTSKAQFFQHYYPQTQYWPSFRVGVGDLDLTEVLNPVVRGSGLLEVLLSLSLLLQPLIFLSPPAKSASNGPQKVIPGARLLWGLVGTLGEVGQLAEPSGVTITEGIATLRSGLPRYGLSSLGTGTAASAWTSRSRACFSLRWRNTRIKTMSIIMRSKQASSGRIMRRGSDAGRGRTSTWISWVSGGFSGPCFSGMEGVWGWGAWLWPPPAPSTLLFDLPPGLPFRVWFPSRLWGLNLWCVLLWCLCDKMWGCKPTVTSPCAVEPPRPPSRPALPAVVLLCAGRRAVVCSRPILSILLKPPGPWRIWWWGKMVKWSSPFAGWTFPDLTRKLKESLRGVAGAWTWAVVSVDSLLWSWLSLSLRFSSMATRPCTTSLNVNDFRTSDALLGSYVIYTNTHTKTHSRGESQQQTSQTRDIL